MDTRAITHQTWNKVASVYQDKYMDMDMYHDTFDVFCRLVEKPHARVFEIGCGPGNITRYLLAKRPDFGIRAIDVAPAMVDLARVNNPGAQFEVMDARDIGGIGERYDAVMCGFCMPYLSKEECATLIQDSACLLHSGGIAYFSTMEDDYEKSALHTNSYGSVYIYYYPENEVRQMLQAAGFEILFFIRRPFPLGDGTFNTDLVFIVKKP